MKKTISFLSLLWALVLAGCGGSLDVQEYNNSFVAIVRECTDSTQVLFESFETEWSTIESIITSLENSIEICSKAETKASKMWDYEWDSSLKDGTVNLLSTEVNYLQKFKSTSPYWNIENITDDDKAQYDGLVNELYAEQENLNAQFETLIQIQSDFAANHKLKLV